MICRLAIQKIKAALCHLLLSSLALSASAYLIFSIWYPGEFFSIAGGSGLFGIVAVVELIIGPCLTLVVFSTTKSRKELVLDYSVIGVIQISALAYGLQTAYNAKPLFLVFSVDRFELVRTLDLPEDTVPPFGIAFMKHGPMLIEAQIPESIEERNEILFSAVHGKDIHLMPKYYANYNAKNALARAKPISLLTNSGLIHSKKLPELCHNRCLWLPLVSQKGIWTALIDTETALPVYFVDLDPFPALEP